MITKGVLFKAYIYIYEHHMIYALPWNSTMTWVIAALAYDCGYYWFHRYVYVEDVYIRFL